MIRMMATAGVLLAGMGLAAQAADVPEVTNDPVIEEAPPFPVFSWTGFTTGVHAGYEIGRDTVALSARSGVASARFNPNGIIGGLHAGYNYALPPIGAGALVVGAEADVDGADDRHTTAALGGPQAGPTVSVRSDVKGSVRARLGYGVNRVLVYTTGGAAFAKFDTLYSGTAGFGPAAFDTHEQVKAGYTLGGGVEYAFMNYLTLRAEYRYSNYGTFVDPINAAAAPGLNATVAHRESDNRLQAGLSYKFDSLVPTLTAQ